MQLPANYVANMATQGLKKITSETGINSLVTSLNVTTRDVLAIANAGAASFPKRNELLQIVFGEREEIAYPKREGHVVNCADLDPISEGYGKLVVASAIPDNPTTECLLKSAAKLQSVESFEAFNGLVAKRAGLQAIARMAETFNAGLVASVINSGASDEAIFNALQAMA